MRALGSVREAGGQACVVAKGWPSPRALLVSAVKCNDLAGMVRCRPKRHDTTRAYHAAFLYSASLATSLFPSLSSSPPAFFSSVTVRVFLRRRSFS